MSAPQDQQQLLQQSFGGDASQTPTNFLPAQIAAPPPATPSPTLVSVQHVPQAPQVSPIPQTPLTNHEVYEFQQQVRQQQGSGAGSAGGPFRASPAVRKAAGRKRSSILARLDRQPTLSESDYRRASNVGVIAPSAKSQFNASPGQYQQPQHQHPIPMQAMHSQQQVLPPPPPSPQLHHQHHQQQQLGQHQQRLSTQIQLVPEFQPQQVQQVQQTQLQQLDNKTQQLLSSDDLARLHQNHHTYHPHFTGYDINSATSSDTTNICSIFLTALSLILVLVTFPISLFCCIKVVQEYERVVIFRLGRLLKGGARGPGIFFVIPCIDTYCKVDLRTVSFDVPPQEILSKDSVTVAVDAVVYYRISNATIAVSNVENYGRSTRLLAATTLRNVLGTKNLSEILSEREAISHIMQLSLDEATEPWGVKVERVEIKDVRLPVQLQRVMASEAEAVREAKAKYIYAEGEQKASRALRNAAEVIAMSPQALQLRYLQTLHSIAAEKSSTIVFPIPLEMFSGLTRTWQPPAAVRPMTPTTTQPQSNSPLHQQQQPDHKPKSLPDNQQHLFKDRSQQTAAEMHNQERSGNIETTNDVHL